MLKSFPVDSFRFFLMRECTFGGDLTFNETALALRHNAELADTFGNLVNRSLNLCQSYSEGVVPSQLPLKIDGFDVDALRDATEAAYAARSLELARALQYPALHSSAWAAGLSAVKRRASPRVRRYKGYQLDVAASLATGALNAVNKFLTDKEPWKIKNDLNARLVRSSRRSRRWHSSPGHGLASPSSFSFTAYHSTSLLNAGASRRACAWFCRPAPLQAILRTTLEAIYVACHFLAPILTEGVASVFEMLGTAPLPICQVRPSLTNLQPGTRTKVGAIMYAKVETKEALAAQAAKAEEEKKKKKAADAKKQAAKAAADKAAAGGGTPAGGGEGTDVGILDIRVGKIVQVERHPEADGLYVEQIDLGEGKPRTVVSGLVKHVPIDQMLNRKVVVLCNLKPSKLKGIESQAMVLCGKTKDEPCSKMELIEPPSAAAVGEKVSFVGVAAEPLDVLPPKKKLWEKLQPQFNTSDAKLARFEALTFDTSAGPCFVATVAGGVVG